ncbi:MAG: isocitrate/isopropylmalate dehydrogenase family protein [Bdellovibrionales bacterium]|nr:isocitrate/isopropylmalate dehydrogenase family protein [Bdellovibrionales bacterium]
MSQNLSRKICILPGDGIGPEVTTSALAVLRTLELPISFSIEAGGYEHYLETGQTISPASLKRCMEADAILYGANTNPAGDSGYQSLTLLLRDSLALHGNIRPVLSFDPDSAVDLVIFRENSECLYVREEREIPDGYDATRRITRSASERIARLAFSYARENSRRQVTIVHKANVLRKTCGLFREVCFQVASEYPDIEVREELVDACVMKLFLKPSSFDVLLTTNLFGDILSDAAAALVGGLGLAPGANIGERHAMFEPVHGSAPDIAGKNLANPTACILATAMMLEHLQFKVEASRIRGALKQLIQRGATTRDLGGTLLTSEFTDELIGELRTQTVRSGSGDDQISTLR